MREDEIRKSKGRPGRPYVVHLHAAHLGNKNPSDPEPALICLCPKHHMQMDRRAELREKLSTRRRGYQITTTDMLLEEVNTAGATVEESPAGYPRGGKAHRPPGKKKTPPPPVGVDIHQKRA